MKKHFNYQGNFLIQSCNNFPQGSGLASSASSFAALTRCALSALSELTERDLPTLSEQASLSRLGSGSSCRSFQGPWVLWQENEVEAVSLPYPDLLHQVVIINGAEKAVSSSEAHRRVRTSPLYSTRPQRAEQRLQDLLLAFRRKDWAAMYEICWDEFQDMHQLFQSCDEPFNYMTADSNVVLRTLQQLWHTTGDGPLVTMDAGPNIHLLYRHDQHDLAATVRSNLVSSYNVL